MAIFLTSFLLFSLWLSLTTIFLIPSIFLSFFDECDKNGGKKRLMLLLMCYYRNHFDNMEVSHIRVMLVRLKRCCMQIISGGREKRVSLNFPHLPCHEHDCGCVWIWTKFELCIDIFIARYGDNENSLSPHAVVLALLTHKNLIFNSFKIAAKRTSKKSKVYWGNKSFSLSFSGWYVICHLIDDFHLPFDKLLHFAISWIATIKFLTFPRFLPVSICIHLPRN